MSRKLMLDAGHGLPSPGKQTLDDPPIKEWLLNQAVVNFITANLEDYNVEIAYSHDPTGITDVALETRVACCNEFNPDLFVSIHHNAYKGEWGKHTGVEVYYHTKGTDADKEFAEMVVPKMSAFTGLANRGVKDAEFVVLTVRATAVLCEGGFMDSMIDHPSITSVKGQQAYAKAVSDSIIEFLGLEKKPTGIIYTVVKGDSLWAISRKYGVTVEEIKEANNLESNTIYIGQELIIPGVEVPEVEAMMHTVVKGDTLWAIGQKYGVTVEEIKKANNLTSNIIHEGQKLVIPEIASPEEEEIPTEGEIPTEEETPTGETGIYTVVKGDNLWAIGQKFGVTVEEIKKANNLTSNIIYIGQKLIIPEVKAPEEGLAPTEEGNTYTVVRGDTLWSISQKYGVTVDAIKQANNLTNNIIYIGQKLILPSTPESPSTSFTAGQVVTLRNASLYVDSTTKSKAANVSGTYVIWSADVVNNRIRITNKSANVGDPNQVTGWIDVASIVL